MIRDSVPRIGKVTLKGGAQLHLVSAKAVEAGMAQWFQNSAAGIAGTMPHMVGYFLVAWDHKGAWNKAVRWSKHNNPIPWRLMPAYMAEIARASLLEEDIKGELIAHGVIRRDT